MPIIKSHRELRVYQSAMRAAIRTLELADKFPPEEIYGWRAQTRSCAPSSCANIAEAWRKRRYKRHFISKLTDAESESAEAQVWMEFGWRRGHINEAEFQEVFELWEIVLKQLVLFEENTTTWKNKIIRVLLVAPIAIAPFLILMILLRG